MSIRNVRNDQDFLFPNPKKKKKDNLSKHMSFFHNKTNGSSNWQFQSNTLFYRQKFYVAFKLIIYIQSFMSGMAKRSLV